MKGEQLVELFDGDEAPKALWQVAGGDQSALPVLRNALNSENSSTRYWAASALALANDESAAGELLKVLKERRDEQPKGNRQAPKWYSSLILLGRLGEKSAVEDIVKIVEDKEVEIGITITAVRALGRIGDASGADAVRVLLQRDDLVTDSILQNSASGKEVVDDGRWRLDLACAEALMKMGQVDRRIIEKYINDERAYIRRAVGSLLAEMDN